MEAMGLWSRLCVCFFIFFVQHFNYGRSRTTSLTREILEIYHQRKICHQVEKKKSINSIIKNEPTEENIQNCINDILQMRPYYHSSKYETAIVTNTSDMQFKPHFGVSIVPHNRVKRSFKYLYRLLRYFMYRIHCILFCWSGRRRTIPTSGGKPFRRITPSIRRPSPNKAPYFTLCPKVDPVFYAEEGKISKVIKWRRPEGEDPEEGKKTPKLIQGKKSGSRFKRGKHQINYKVTDSRGASANCFFEFEVKVIRCEKIKRPKNGQVHCSRRRFIYGSYCDLTCSEGYRFENSTSGDDTDDDEKSVNRNDDHENQLNNTDVKRVVCGKDDKNEGAHIGSFPKCIGEKCSGNDPAMRPVNGKAVCSNSKLTVGTTCVTKCKDGYKLPKGSGLSTTCKTDKTWTDKLPSCVDAQSPGIRNCPKSFQVYTEKGKKTALVLWVEPTADDNSGKAIVEQTHGLLPNSTFPLGTTEIHYKATDQYGNVSPTCIFSVKVEEIKCRRPELRDPFVNYSCPQGFGYGATCQLTCLGSFPLLGEEKITCERNDTRNTPVGYWNMGSREPQCGRNPCSKLPPPKNGAMACDTWIFGMQCQMQCNDDFDIPYGIVGGQIKNFNGIFICSEKTGKWIPSRIVPGCTAKRKPGQARTLGLFFYYTDDCGEEDVDDDNNGVTLKIKDNFISQLSHLESSGWDGICADADDCNVKNVEVTCGPETLRLKRSADSEDAAEFSSRISVSFTIMTDWVDNGSSMKDAYNHVGDIHANISQMIKDEASKGKFNVGDYVPNMDSFTFKDIEPLCQDKGYSLRLKSLTCAPCSPGTSLNADNECQNCRRGTYRDNVDDLECTVCPTGTYTIDEGSRNANDCIAICEPGFYSDTRVEPCVPCPKGTYTSIAGSSQCNHCPSGKTTTFSSSNSSSDCKDFDVSLKRKSHHMTFGNPGTDATNITFTTWIKPPDNDEDAIFIDILYPTRQLSVKLKDAITIIFTSSDPKTDGSEVFVCSEKLPKGKWTHLAMSYGARLRMLGIYFNGKNVCLQVNYKQKDTGIMLAWSNVIIGLNQDSKEGFSLSKTAIYHTVLEQNDLVTLATGCDSKLMKTTPLHSFENNTADVDIITPSLCSDLNFCDGDPCNGHICLDSVFGYSCQCQNGSYGDRCQYKPDYCANRPCLNGGTCLNTNYNFTCMCAEGYRGPLCDDVIVNGAWSQWSEWTECSKSCDGGSKVRTRTCTDPPPDEDGLDCPPTVTREQVLCNVKSCPSCSKLSSGTTNTLTCTDVGGGHTECEVSCKPGYAFVSGTEALPVYRCGPSTDYKWNGRHPPCGKVESPKTLSTVSSITYKSLPCPKKDEALDQLKGNALSSLQCVKNKKCDMDIVVKKCDKDRQRRSTESATTFELTLTKTLEGGDNLDLAEYIVSKNVSSALSDLIQGVAELEETVSQMTNISAFMDLNIDGVSHTPSSVYSEAETTCPEGYSKEEAFCVPCPEGTYSGAGFCHPCPVGTYQDMRGQSKCKQCKMGYTTLFVGSTNFTECSEKTDTCDNGFRCSDGPCIDKGLFCNNHPDCEDWSDETNVQCLYGCKPDQFICADGRCIDGHNMCDGTAHCKDASDESKSICDPLAGEVHQVKSGVQDNSIIVVIVVALISALVILGFVLCLCTSGKTKSTTYTVNSEEGEPAKTIEVMEMPPAEEKATESA